MRTSAALLLAAAACVPVTTAQVLPAELSLRQPGVTPYVEGTDAHFGRVKCRLHYQASTVTEAADSGAKDEDTASDTPAFYDVVTRDILTLNTCIHDVHGSYGYDVCFGREHEVLQANTGNNGRKVRLGSFQSAQTEEDAGNKDPLSKEKVLYFADGDGCAPNVRRRTRVQLYCGSMLKIVEASEPASCEYELQVTMPKLCEYPSLFQRYESKVRTPSKGTGTESGPASSRVRGQLSSRAKSALGAEGEAILKMLEDNSKRQLQEAAAVGGSKTLSVRDLPGHGAKTIGLEDQERHGEKWSGLTADQVQNAPTTSWLLDLHTVWPEGLEHGGREWACTAYSSDDLRKGVLSASGGKRISTVKLEMVVPAKAMVRDDPAQAARPPNARVGPPSLQVVKAYSASREVLPTSLEFAVDATTGDTIVTAISEIARYEEGDIASIELQVRLLDPLPANVIAGGPSTVAE